MPSSISKVQCRELRALLSRGRVVSFYSYFADRGYYYACWATGDIDGAAGTKGGVVPGLSLETAQRLTEDELARIRVAMAGAYLDALEAQFANGRYITRDVTAEETAGFHGDVFRSHFLGLNDWTLFLPFEQQEKAGGLEAVERYWQGVLRTSAQLSARALARSAASLQAA
ncbi:hypothetical protein [Variovorax sp. JS1663]|uniref:hypothetical protein n=1 Tax=Variovorax sp. JS1663 TaxID=1851577 RepID=UPI000B3486A3|nr:hypothetical protein [Variovorax sp. JS1663]OUM00253.1 hypothetical protein A8M77_22290 [Variovorax sp. JS1663]